MTFYTDSELEGIGFLSYGNNVKISKMASIYGAEFISLGNDVRIDDFCIISAGDGGIAIGSFVHVAAHTLLIGKARIEIKDFANLSGRVSVYSNNDDYSGSWMTNPTVPARYTQVMYAPVTIGKHSIIGAGSVILPGAVLENGVAIGALSLVKGYCREFGIYAGTPAKRVSERKKSLLVLEQEFLATLKNDYRHI